MALAAGWLAAGLFVECAQARSPGFVELAQVEADDAIWSLIAETDDPTLLEDFIAQYPSSRHVQAARTRLAALKAGTMPPPVATPPRTDPKPPVAGPVPMVPAPPPVAGAPPADPRPPEQPKPEPSKPEPSKVESKPRVAEPAPSVDGPKPRVAEPAPPVNPSPPIIMSGPPTEPTQTYGRAHVGPSGLNGLRLDWCLRWGRDCGKPAADLFCQAQGYGGASSFERQATGGQTWVAEDQQICSGAVCTALANVVCERPVKAPAHMLLDTILSPRINQLPLAECLDAGQGCGQVAADTFCRAGGFARALRFDLSPEGTRAFYLRAQTVCDGPQCRALKNVACTR